MATRQSTVRVSSEEIQGEGSYVVLRYMKFGLVLEAMEKTEGKSNPKDEKEYTLKLLRDAVVEWNWVDDNGAPLPLPSEGLEIESLLTNEVVWLVEQVTGREKAKNSKSGSPST